MNEGKNEILHDEPVSFNNASHKAVLDGIGRYFQQLGTLAQPEFQEAFDLALATLNRTGSMRESFQNFNAGLGRQIPSTPPEPAPMLDYQRSPVVEPLSRANPFTNAPPYARVGSTY
jgi:hypothetical protein